MKTSLVLSVATLLVATSPTYAIDVPTSTAKVKSAQQFKEETTKHYDKMYFLSEVKLKQQKTNREKQKSLALRYQTPFPMQLSSIM